IGTRNSRLVHFQDGRFEVWDKSRGLEVSPISALMADNNGTLWIGGVARMPQFFRDGHFTTLQLRQNPHTIRAIIQDTAGAIWMGTSRGILLRIDGTNAVDQTEKISSAIKSIRCLYPA